MLTKIDQNTLSSKGISEETLMSQLERFRTGFPYLRLSASANVPAGILRLTYSDEEQAQFRWQKYLADGGEVFKFVPASGAASRMFKSLFAFVNGEDDVPEPGTPVAEVIDRIEYFAFASELNDVLVKLHGKGIEALKNEGRYKDIISAIVKPEGLNYGGLPKGLLSFHKYAGGDVRTPLEEQMAEGAQTASSNGVVKLHFTVSGNHKTLFEKKIQDVKPALEKKYGVRYDISLSEQKPSTDTVAATAENELFRTKDGNLVFRPGGHGALIENLNDIDSAVVFIKNIDNVVPDSNRKATIKYKKILAGVLINVHDTVQTYLEMLNTGNDVIEDLRRMILFLHDTLNVRYDKLKYLDDKSLAEFLKAKLDRPLRVCGMVRNEGEPGGGPYIAYNADGTTSPQILESSQIDMSNPENVAMMQKATHFNPVDLVCYIKDIKGKHYDLRKYVDPDTGFISSKSYEGRELKALELPGLWNGAMSDWSTVFVEVPSATFNPVKVVNDLLRPAHQS